MRQRNITIDRKAGHTIPTDATKEIPEDEQWRLIHKSGILQKANDNSVQEQAPSLGEEIFNTITMIIPISSLLLLMEILINSQYGQRATLRALTEKMTSGVPILAIFIFYTTRYKAFRKMQISLFIIGVLSGCRTLYLVNHGSWLVNMQQCPPLITIWVYTVVQLDLLPAVLSLGVVGIYVWWQGLSLQV